MIGAQDPLQASLTRAIERVGPYLRAYRVYLEPPASAETVAAPDLVRREPLRHYAARAVKEWSDRPWDEDPRAAVSRLVRRYLGSLVTAALVPLAHGIGIDTSPERVRIVLVDDLPRGVVLDVDEVFTSAERPTTWPVHGRDVGDLDALRRRALVPLFTHCAWLFDTVMEHIKVSSQLLWSTAAEQVDGLYENAIDGPDAGVFAHAAADRELMLFGDSLPGVAGPNPMRDVLFWEPYHEGAHRIQVRRVCCANFVVPGRTQVYCRNCGLITPAERLAKWDEWRASGKTV